MMEPSSEISLANAAPPRVMPEPLPYSGMSKPIERAQRDEALTHDKARKAWLDAEKQAQQERRAAALQLKKAGNLVDQVLCHGSMQGSIGMSGLQSLDPAFDVFHGDLRSFLRCADGNGLHDPGNRFPTIHEPPAGAKPRPRASSSLRAVWHRLKALNARFEDSWAGDLVGALCLVGIMVIVIFLPLILGEVYP